MFLRHKECNVGGFVSGIMFRAGICLMAGRLLDRFAFIWRRRNVFASHVLV